MIDLQINVFFYSRFQNAEAAKKNAEGIDNLAVDSMPMEEKKQEHND